MVKKFSKKFLYSSHTLGYICSILIRNNNNLYLFIMPILFSFISLIIYIVLYKNKINEKYILIHILIDFAFLIWMTYFL